MQTISKSDFKVHALEILRDIEKSGKSRIITDRGQPTLEIRKLRREKIKPLDKLKGTVIQYKGPTEAVADDEWENA